MAKVLHVSDIRCIFASLLGTNLLTKEFGKVVEWSITAVLKTAVLRGTGGSNPSLSAEESTTSFHHEFVGFFRDI